MQNYTSAVRYLTLMFIAMLPGCRFGFEVSDLQERGGGAPSATGGFVGDSDDPEGTGGKDGSGAAPSSSGGALAGVGGMEPGCFETGCSCFADQDCDSRACRNGSCVEATCDDGRVNQGEEGIDCGGPCSACPFECTNLVADSVADFSAIQGANGWSYGYLEAPNLTTNDFLEMALYEGGAWSVSKKNWTSITAERMHPNGTYTGLPKTPVEHHAVRRWMNGTRRTLTAQGVVQRNNTNGNGIISRIFVAGMMVWEQTIVAGAVDPVDFLVTFEVGANEPVDFVVDPLDSHDISDWTHFEVQLCEQ